MKTLLFSRLRQIKEFGIADQIEKSWYHSKKDLLGKCDVHETTTLGLSEIASILVMLGTCVAASVVILLFEISAKRFLSKLFRGYGW